MAVIVPCTVDGSDRPGVLLCGLSAPTERMVLWTDLAVGAVTLRRRTG